MGATPTQPFKHQISPHTHLCGQAHTSPATRTVRRGDPLARNARFVPRHCAGTRTPQTTSAPLRGLADRPSHSERTAANKVQGCVSQVWLKTEVGPGPDPVISFIGDSDAHIVRGLVAIMLALYSGKSARQIVDTDAEETLQALGLDEHLTPQRANGLRSMIDRIKRDARAALSNAA